MSSDEITRLVTGLGNYLDVLRQANPQDKAQVYSQLNLKLTYRPQEQEVRAEACLNPLSSEKGSCPRPELNQSPTLSVTTDLAVA